MIMAVATSISVHVVVVMFKLKHFSPPGSPSAMTDLEANLARTMSHLAQNTKDLEVIQLSTEAII